jgi:xanthine dehydrogenase small subunit
MTTGSHKIDFSVNGTSVSVSDDGASLLEVLRDRLGVRSVKDGCSPQGQCGCCTVFVDGQPRVSCVTPVRRVTGRSITTIEGLENAHDWAMSLCATGGSQCGFCTPGIILRLDGLRERKGVLDEPTVRDALKAHLCRCTGWQTIVEAAVAMPVASEGRDFQAAARRAELEGGAAQTVGPQVALGAAGFADDTAPHDALVAVRNREGDWVVAETLLEARRAAGKVQGRRTTAAGQVPLEVPAGDWAVTLQTQWIEPAYLETDASWCLPGGVPTSALANGGAFGAKVTSTAGDVARRLADEHGQPVRVLFSREDTVRFGPKRPPIAAGLRSDGSGLLVVARTDGIGDAIAHVAPDIEVREVDIAGPPTSVDIRGAGWMEALVLSRAATGAPIVTPAGGEAEAHFDGEVIRVQVSCGDPLDEVVLRSYCIGAAHMGFSWVTSELLTVDETGDVLDLTMRSFGIVRAVDTPRIEIEIAPGSGPGVNGSDAVLVAVAAAVWEHGVHAPLWPTGAVSAHTS